MLESILRPVTVPSHLLGTVSPCDLFNARGTLLLRTGTPIPEHVESMQHRHRLFCKAGNANLISSTDPIGELRFLAARLSVLAERVEYRRPFNAHSFITMAENLHDLWSQDADACLGYARLVHLERPSVHHAIHAALLAAELGMANSMARQERIMLIGAALTMNLGSMILHDEMHELIGEPDAATREDILAHPAEAARLLKRMDMIPHQWMIAVLESHEHLDGTGYPLGLKRVEISLLARMLRIVDTLAARLSGRKGRPPRPWLIHQARDTRRLTQHVFGSDLEHLDQSLVRLLMRRLGAFPPGALVRLSNSEIALVGRRHSKGARQPQEVISIISAHGRPLDTPRARKISARELKINGYADDFQPQLAHLDWQTVWGYHH